MQHYLAQAAAQPTGGLAAWSIDLIDALGGVGIAIISGLDAMISIVPADLVMPLVGFSASLGAINLFTAIAWATMGTLTGATAMYALGAALGRDRTRAMLVKIPGCRPKHIDRSEAWFQRHGAKSVLFGRLLPGIRPLVSLPAGIERMYLPKFLALTAIGSLMWNSILLIAGYVLGSNWHLVSDIAGMLIYLIIAAAIAAAVYFVAKRRRANRVEAATASANAAER